MIMTERSNILTRAARQDGHWKRSYRLLEGERRESTPLHTARGERALAAPCPMRQATGTPITKRICVSVAWPAESVGANNKTKNLHRANFPAHPPLRRLITHPLASRASMVSRGCAAGECHPVQSARLRKGQAVGSTLLFPIYNLLRPSFSGHNSAPPPTMHSFPVSTTRV